MLYRIFRYFLWILYAAFYRRVYYINAKAIPKKKPLMFTSNHSNGLMDPIFIASFQWRPVWFWTMATELGDNIKGRMMRRLHGLPIYRKQEGKENMYKNEETFKISRELMYKGDTVYLAPEGRCVCHKRLLPFKTGCARLAFKMMEEKNWEIDVKIMPVGVNYTYHELFRSEVYVKFGELVSVQDYKQLYLEDNFKAATQLTEDLSKAIRAEMIYIEKEEDEALVEHLLIMGRNSFSRGIFPLYSTKDIVFRLEQNIANYVNELDESQKGQLKKQVADYQVSLAASKVDDYAVAGKNKRSFFWVLFGLPIWGLGTVSGKIPHIVARNLRNKFVPFVEFATSFAITASFLVWILWSILVVAVGAFFLGWLALLLPIIMVFSQIYAYHYEDYYKEWKKIVAYKGTKNKIVLEQKNKAILDLFL